ncbi:MAG TPA: universal stress protein [Baekduia sp.]|jgi:nucleotide-binding universal stress UspA family protein
MALTLGRRPPAATAAPNAGPRPIAVVLDGSPSSEAALECAVDLARSRCCALTLMVMPAWQPAHVVWCTGAAVVVSTPAAQAAAAARILAQAGRAIPPDLVISEELVAGPPRDAIRRRLRDGSHQLLVAGRGGVGRAGRRALRGRGSDGLTPVLVVSR